MTFYYLALTAWLWCGVAGAALFWHHCVFDSVIEAALALVGAILLGPLSLLAIIVASTR